MSDQDSVWLGVDTGGTYTDSVLIRAKDRAIIRSAKRLTRHDNLCASLDESMSAILDGFPDDRFTIRLVAISTTLATNAIVEGKGNRTCSLLIGYDDNMAKRAELAALGDPFFLVAGGHDGHGVEKTPLDIAEVEKIALAMKDKVDAFAISSLFSVRNSTHEATAKEIIERLTGLPVTCGHELTSQLDAPKRALTATLNARLIPQLRALVVAMRHVVAQKGIVAPLMMVRGDGSMISASEATTRPVETILSGPAASLVGMRFLSGLDDFILSDIGGTTTDIAIVQGGRPRLNESGAEIGGYRTMVKAINVHTIGLGGDSEVHVTPQLRLGPRRVVPLSLLAAEYPSILDELTRQSLTQEPIFFPARFLLRNNKPTASFQSKAEEKLFDLLTDGPTSLAQLHPGPALQKAADTMIARGLIALAGPTPSDAQHVLGRQKNWNCLAAELALTIIGNVYLAGQGARQVANDIADSVIKQSCQSLLEVAIGRKVAKNDFAHELIEATARGRAAPSRFIRHRLQLDLPLAAAGAPAELYYPEIARRLGTTARLSPYSSVANAIGAVLCGIFGKAEIPVTQPRSGLYRVHLGDRLEDFDDAAQAIERAKKAAETLARQEAHRFGAPSVEISLKVDKKEIERGRLLEARITAEATGSPFIHEA